MQDSEVEDILSIDRSKDEQMITLERYKNIMLNREEKDNMTAVTLKIGK